MDVIRWGADEINSEIAEWGFFFVGEGTGMPRWVADGQEQDLSRADVEILGDTRGCGSDRMGKLPQIATQCNCNCN